MSPMAFVRCCAAIYRHLLSDRKFGLTHNLLATKVMPSLIPLSISPGYSLDQVINSHSLMPVLTKYVSK